MYKDCVITTVSNLSFYGKVLVWYKGKNDEKIALKIILNKNKSVVGNSIYSNGNSVENFNFSSIKELVSYLEKIKEKIYFIEMVKESSKALSSTNQIYKHEKKSDIRKDLS
jgi:hypothetical protein